MLKTLEAQLRFYPGVHINLFRTDDNLLVETVAFTGEQYHKNLISLTNQIGCPVKCDFCKVAEMGYLRNITPEEYLGQVQSVMDNEGALPWFDPQREVKVCFTRAGEALLNRHTFDGLVQIAEKYQPSFQFTSVLPKVPLAYTLLEQMKAYLQPYENTFQINISMHTSDEEKRRVMMGAYPGLMDFKEMAEWGREWYAAVGKRKINLSFVLMDDNEVDLRKIRELFHPAYFAVRFAMYLPSTPQTARLHPASPLSVMALKAREAQALGYECIESVAKDIEKVWDTRPHSGFTMYREKMNLKGQSLKYPVS